MTPQSDQGDGSVEDPGKDVAKATGRAARKKKSGVTAAEAEVAATREEFAATLDAIEDKLNPRTQFRRARGAFSKIVSRSKE